MGSLGRSRKVAVAEVVLRTVSLEFVEGISSAANRPRSGAKITHSCPARQYSPRLLLMKHLRGKPSETFVDGQALHPGT